MRRTAIVLAGAVLLLTAACSSGQQTNENRSGQTGFVSGNGQMSVFAPNERKPAPAFGGETLDGKEWKFADHKGKVVVLNVWGSWCPPCRKEAPALIEAAKQVGPEVEFIGLNTRDLDKAPAKKFVQEFGVTFPSLFDPSGKQLLGFRGQISPTSIPSTLVIDKQGRVASRVIGEVTTQTLVGMVKDAG
ncbi:thiol-disulfide isomerase/thioredoxin [Kribbella amoyensis]|uniref:Thiol-disulfide isomerase/thioredoxin n=1 Tax=Kribbella amoyensis TaxID=996641 RepID=A0A561BLI4_9ACTN|nr:TlpA disulfide reductase family protein [Kribbella amoyensis]TWD79719.1 thiol-disulfide isomerase/thioredoxin [Kribbella amoyensis]